MKTLLRHLVFGLLGIAMLLAIAGPLALYGAGLYAAGAMPTPPSEIATVEQQAATWRRMQGHGVPSVPKLNPYSFLLDMVTAAPQDPGVLAAWQVASGYLLVQRRYSGMFWWHLSGAALAIWLTRNWSTEQILSQASQARVRSAD